MQQKKYNQSLPLLETRIVEIDSRAVDIPICFEFLLFPQAIVIGDADGLPPELLNEEKFGVVLANGARFDAILASTNLGTLEGSIAPLSQPLTVINQESLLTELNFPVLNFPPVLGKQSKWINAENSQIKIPHIQINMPHWRIEISGVNSIWDVSKKLRRDRSVGVTYNGRITCLNQSEFTVEKAESLLTAFKYFLSFARSASCSFPLVEGKDREGNISWVKWGSGYVAPWNNQQSLLAYLGCDDTLSDLFPKFWNLLNSGEDWRRTALSAIDWYLLSSNSAVEVGIILIQVSLELLASQVLGKGPDGSTGKFIRKAFCELKLPTCIPASCKELTAFQQINSCYWEDGLHALVEFRNSIVHAKKKKVYANLSLRHKSEVLTLGQWFIEMFLLKKMDYRGKYHNRLATRENGLENYPLVPWAKPV